MKRPSPSTSILFNPTGILYLQEGAPSEGPTAAGIAVVAVGAAAAVAGLVAGVWLALRRRRRRRRQRQQSDLQLAKQAAAPAGLEAERDSSMEAGVRRSGDGLPSPFMAAGRAAVPFDRSSIDSSVSSVPISHLALAGGLSRRPPLQPAAPLGLRRSDSAPPLPQQAGRGQAQLRLQQGARSGSDPAGGAGALQPAAMPAGDASLVEPSTPRRSGGQGDGQPPLSGSTAAALSAGSPVRLSRTDTLASSYGSTAVPGGAGLPRHRSLTTLLELVEHVAQQEAAAGDGSGGGAAAAASSAASQVGWGWRKRNKRRATSKSRALRPSLVATSTRPCRVLAMKSQPTGW